MSNIYERNANDPHDDDDDVSGGSEADFELIRPVRNVCVGINTIKARIAEITAANQLDGEEEAGEEELGEEEDEWEEPAVQGAGFDEAGEDEDVDQEDESAEQEDETAEQEDETAEQEDETAEQEDDEAAAMEQDVQNLLEFAENNDHIILTNSQNLRRQQEIDSRSVYVGNLDYRVSAMELEQHFSSCGIIQSVTITSTRRGGASQGYAYIEFALRDSVDNAENLNGTDFHGRTIRVMKKKRNNSGTRTSNRYQPARRFSEGRNQVAGSSGTAPLRGPTSSQNFYSPY